MVLNILAGTVLPFSKSKAVDKLNKSMEATGPCSHPLAL